MIPSSFLIILLAFGAYGALHSLLAADAVKTRAQQLLGAKAYRSYRLAFNLLSGLALLPGFLSTGSTAGALTGIALELLLRDPLRSPIKTSPERSSG